jgi:hypothetical protein
MELPLHPNDNVENSEIVAQFNGSGDINQENVLANESGVEQDQYSANSHLFIDENGEQQIIILKETVHAEVQTDYFVPDYKKSKLYIV